MQFWLCRPHFVFIFANAVRSWDVGPALAQSWAPIEQFYTLLYFVVCEVFVGQELGPYWVYLGPSLAMLGHFGPCWHHIGLMLSHFGLFWELFCPCKAFARNTVNTSKKYTFGLVADGLCSLFWVMFVSLLWELFCPCKAFAKNTVNTSKKYVADGLCFLFWVMFVSFLWGMLHLVYACLISGLCWTILGYVSAMLGSC